MCTQPPESTIDEHVSIRNKKKNDDDNNREWKKPLASYCRRIILVGTQNVRASWLKVVIDLPPIAASVACIISNYLNCSWIKTRTIPLDRIIRADVLFNGNQRRPQLGKYSTFGLESQLILNKVISWNGNGTIYKKNNIQRGNRPIPNFIQSASKALMFGRYVCTLPQRLVNSFKR